MKLQKLHRIAIISCLGAFIQLSPDDASAQTILYVSDPNGISAFPSVSSSVQNLIPLQSGGTYDLTFSTSGNLFATNNQSVYEIGPDGAVSTFATGLAYPEGLAFGSNGNLYVADTGADSVLEITPQGVVSTFATGLNNPTGLAFDASGNLFVSNDIGPVAGNGTISKITPQGVVSTFASGLFGPNALTFNTSGNLFGADGSGDVYQISSTGNISYLATSLGGDGGLLVNSNGNLLFSDQDGIQQITLGGNVSNLYAFNSTAYGMAFGPASFSVGVPEPAAWAWLGGGLALVMAAWRKFRR